MPDAKKALSLDVDFIERPGSKAAAAAIDPAGAVLELTPEVKTSLAPQKPERLGLRLRAEQQIRAGLLDEEQVLGKTDDEVLELVIGRSNVLPAWFLQVGAERSRCVCKIDAEGIDYRGNPNVWAGTGFLVSPSVLLTNHHVLNSAVVAASARCTFNYQDEEDGRPAPVRTYRLNPSRLFLTSPAVGGLDFTFVWVDGEPGNEQGSARLDRRAFKILPREFANTIHHPEGEPKAVTVQENQILAQQVVTIHYTSDTKPGSSGAPVFNNEWRLVALHHASRKAEYGEGVEGKPDKYVNEGVLFSAIATRLEAIAAAGSGGGDAAAARELLDLFQGSDALSGFFGTIGRSADGATEPEAVVTSYRGEADDLDVGFWNVEWFNKTYERKLHKVARIVAEMNLDVWSLEESSPDAAEALASYLKQEYGLDFGFAASEPAAAQGKQSTTVLWNKKTAEVVKEKWPDEIDRWFHIDSREFDEDMLEAIDGRVFDRYPGLFHVSTPTRAERKVLDFYLVPLHLKAMAEGSKRRRMAAQILAAAVGRMIGKFERDKDWVIGGDFNAPLASEDFTKLIEGGLVALSEDDEGDGSFSYVKSPKSLIDQIYVSANLSKLYGAKDFFIVASEKRIPKYVKEVSDHRPVLVRLALSKTPKKPKGKKKLDAALVELLGRLR